jgi:hypothetical protein
MPFFCHCERSEAISNRLILKQIAKKQKEYTTSLSVIKRESGEIHGKSQKEQQH